MAQDGTAGDVSVRAALSPHAAVARIRQSPHDDAVDLFASASPDILTGKLKALLLADEATAVAILADLDPLKAAELIYPHRHDFPSLAALPMQGLSTRTNVAIRAAAAQEEDPSQA